jgi:SagB-type dehydrogenase family enzyme
MRRRHSVRSFDARRPIALAELAGLLDIARVSAQWEGKSGVDENGPPVSYARRPYPSGGASYALELYLAVNACDGLARGFYHYDAGAHALTAIDVKPQDLASLLTGAAGAMGVGAPPQILITIAARFGRVSWKYSSLAYSLILKESGVLMQTLYLMATDLGLGGCAIGSTNIDLFARMTGIEFHVEGPVGQFALGRPAPESP